MNVIETNNLIKIYQQGDIEVKALNDVSINFQQGEFTAIVGPSGSGKTTFLNSIGGLDTPTSGKVVINDTDITNLKSNELIDFRLRNIGFVFQAYNLIPVLTAKENVEFIMLMQGDSASDRKSRAEELLNAVGLSDQINRRPGQLSGGQQQRVAVARALASKPKFVLAIMLDEPKINKDYIYEYRDGSNFKLKGSPRNTAGWNSVEVSGHIIEKIGPILATKYSEIN